ncbi:uncharacterized protein [Montipora foliosa]|uniref:uncharacterized protein n=1 Tax=Montipora foliosa TaxID=591990 RepID=UPI0035F11978
MALTSQLATEASVHRVLSRRTSQNSSSTLVIPEMQAVDFCRGEPRLVELEQQLYSLANGTGNLQSTKDNCLSLLLHCDNTSEVFKVFCSCSWMDRFADPVISGFFYQLSNIQQDGNTAHLLLAELEKSCEQLLKILTHLEVPNMLQLNVVCLLCNLSRLSNLPKSHLDAVKSYMEEIARALWPYSRPSAPDLWSSEAFCDAQCDVLKACGKSLKEKCPVNTERTLHKINGKLISGDISQYARFRLLEIQELCFSGWEVSKPTLSYYKAVYQKLKNQSGKNVAVITDCTTRNGYNRINSFQESSVQTIGKAAAVLRISEDELRQSCENLHEPIVCRDVVAEERILMVDHRSGPSVHRIELSAEPVASSNRINKDFKNKDLKNEDCIQPEMKTREEASANSQRSIKGMIETKTQPCVEGVEECTLINVSQELNDTIEKRASSPCSSDNSDEVFPSKLVPGRGRPAMFRGDFTKPRRPFKSDSSSSSVYSESHEPRTALLSDSSVIHVSVESSINTFQPLKVETSLDINHTDGDFKMKANSIEAISGLADADATKAVAEVGGMNSTCSSDKDLGVSCTDNWRRTPTSALGECTSHTNNTTSESVENWRERKSYSFSGSQKNRSQNENWRENKSLSLDETVQNVKSALTSYGQAKRFSLGDVKMERQDSEETGKGSPRGGFGLPKQASQELEGALSDEQHQAPKCEKVEVQLSEDESQDLRWWRLAEIQNDTGCKLVHDKENFTIVIEGDPLQCKAAKTRVYSVVAALQEEFGALVPLSSEILEHLQTEGRNMLADRLALCTAANVKMINDAQLFISGHRNCVHNAKQHLAKIKVMLKYSDDPDVASISQQDFGEEDLERVNRLFAALEERPRRFSQTDNSNDKQETPSEGSLSREFLISCASNPLAQNRPSDLSLERNEDWVTAIVLDNVKRGERDLFTQKKGFGFHSERHPSVEAS